jgi:hypothetical protein
MPTYKIQIKEDGQIEGCQKIEAENDAFWVDGISITEEAYLVVVADLKHAIDTRYFDFQTEIFIGRPEINAEPNKLTLLADGIDSVAITDLPIPCTVKVGNDTHQLSDPEDTTFEFTTDTVGTFTVTVEQFPYITKSWEIEAV